jgi:LMBR1-like membrane protein
VIALSYGLIKVPKRQWEQRDLKIMLGYRYYLVKIYEDNRREAILALTDLYGVLVLLKEKVSNTSMVVDERNGALDAIYKQIPAEILPALKEAHESGVSRTQDYNRFLTKPMITMPLIVEFNTLFQSALNDLIMAEHLRRENLIDVYYYRRIKDCIENGDQFIPDKFTSFKAKDLLFKLFDGSEYTYYKKFHFKWSLINLGMLAALSGLVFLGQIQIYFNHPIVSKALTGLLVLHDTVKYASVLILVSGFFGYMVYVSCHSLFSVKIQGYYGFYPGRTDPTTLLTFVFYLSKLTYPLCYTTLLILLGESNQIEQTSFYSSIGDLSVVPILGYDIQRYLPVLFMFLLVLFYFDYFSLILAQLGFRFYNFNNNSGQASTEELQGKRIAHEYENLFYEELLSADKNNKQGDQIALLGQELYLI